MADITLIQVDADLARLNQYNLALEGFQRLMEGREVITGPTAMAMRIALEDAEVDQERDNDKGVSGKDLASGFKKVMITIRNVIQWLLREIGKLIEKLGLGMQKLGNKKSKAQKKRAAMSEQARNNMGKSEELVPPGANKEESSEETSAEPSAPAEKVNPVLLSINGTFVGNDVEAVNNVVKMGAWINEDFPKMFDSLMNDVVTIARKNMRTNSAVHFYEELGKSIQRNFIKPKVMFSGQSHTSGHDDAETINTVPLLGDFGLTMVDPAGADALKGTNPVELLRKWFVMDFGEYNTKKDGDVTIPSSDFQTMSKLLDMVDKSIASAESSAKAGAAVMNKRVDDVNKFLNEMGEADIDSSVPGEIASGIAVIMQRMVKCLTDTQAWYGRTLFQELTYLSACMDSGN